MPRVLVAGSGLALLVLAAGAAAAARPVHAAPAITVNSLADGHLDGGATTCVSAAAGGACTLRAALELNDANGGGSAVTLALPGSGQIKLTLGELPIFTSVTISGPSAASVVTGDLKHRVFDIAPDAGVVMSGFTILGGNALDGTSHEDSGGGIQNFGNLTLDRVVLLGNLAAFGGGVADFGTLRVLPGTVFSQNQALVVSVDGEGTEGGLGGGLFEAGTLVESGGLYGSETAERIGGHLAVGRAVLAADETRVVSLGRASITGAWFTAGNAPSSAGAFLDVGTSADIEMSTFSGLVAQPRPGRTTSAAGAIGNECGTLTLVNDTFDQNRADNGVGGAIVQECGSTGRTSAAAAVAASRLVGSEAGTHPVSAPPQSRPAGTRVATTPSPSPTPAPKATATLDFVTIAESSAGILDGQSGGNSILVVGDRNTFQVHDTIVSMKAGAAGKNCVTINTAITSQGYNLDSTKDCGFTKTGDQTGIDPKLGALAGNGGATQTMALTAGTPAVDSADPTCDVKTDQRGVTRPQGSRCDIGAFELQVATPATPTPLPSPPVTGSGPSPLTPSFLAFVLALLAIPAVGAGLLIARRRSA